MNNYFIILAAGKGKRFRSKTPKQYIIYNGKPKIFLNEMKKKNLELEMKNNIWTIK